MRFLRRLIKALHYAANPGGETNRARLSRATAAARKRSMTEQLRREVTEARLVRAVANAVLPVAAAVKEERGR